MLIGADLAIEDTSFPGAIYASDSVPYEAKSKSLSSCLGGYILLFHLLFLFPKDGINLRLDAE